MRAREIIEFLNAMSKAATAMRIAEATGDAHAKKHGRTIWSHDDYEAATMIFDALCPSTTPDDLMLRAKQDHDVAVAMSGGGA